MLLQSHFESLFQHLNKQNATYKSVNVPNTQFVSFIAIRPNNNGIEFIFNNELQQQVNVEFIKQLNAADNYLVIINNNRYIVNGKPLRRLLVALTLTNEEFLKASNSQNFKLLYGKDPNKAIAAFLFDLAKIVNKNQIREEAIDALAHATHLLTSFNEQLIAHLKPYLSDAYAKIAVLVGEYVSFRLFIKIVVDAINKLLPDAKLTIKLIPATIVAAGVGFTYLVYLESAKQLLGQHAQLLEAAKYAILLDALLVGIMFVFLPLLTGHMVQQFSKNELDKKTNNMASLLSV